MADDGKGKAAAADAAAASAADGAGGGGGGGRPPPVKVGRFTQSPMSDPWQSQHLCDTMRETDVVFNTFPKMGQTATQALLVALMLNGDMEQLRDTGGLFSRSPWGENAWPVVGDDNKLRLPTREERVKMFAAVPSPRVFKQHVPWDEVLIPSDPAVAAKVKYVTITRHIEDVPFSFFKHLHAHTPEFMALKGLPPMMDDLDGFVRAWFCSDASPFPIVPFFRSLWARRNDENLLILRYEDLTQRKRETALKLCAFLGWPTPDDATMEKVLAGCSLEYMKKHQNDIFFDSGLTFRGAFIREGKVGVNKQQLSDDTKREIRAYLEANLEPDCVKMLYREE